MSYSIGATSATKAELELAIRDKLAEIPVAQPVHKDDINQAFNAAKSLLDLMQDDPARDLYCFVSGSIWKKETGVENISLSVSINHVDRKS